MHISVNKEDKYESKQTALKPNQTGFKISWVIAADVICINLTRSTFIN